MLSEIVFIKAAKRQYVYLISSTSTFLVIGDLSKSWKKGNAKNDLINMLKIEHKAAMKWFCDNKMNVNPDKIQINYIGTDVISV